MDNADPELFEELMEAVRRVASRAAFTLGDEVSAFEEEFAAYCETDHAVGVSSGTDALVLGLRALGVGPGDEVIVPASSFIATAEAVSLVGATPCLVDTDPVTHTLTAEIVERSLTPATRCVIPVHLYGRTVDLDPIMDVASAAGVAVIEDACQAHGARYRGRRAGGIGDCAAFSFYPSKNLGAWGDGGALVTSNPEIAERVRLLRSHGERARYDHVVCGATARLDGIQAAVLRVKLRRLEGWNEDRRRVALGLTTALKGCGLGMPASVPADQDHVFHQYVVTSPERDELRAYLAEAGVASGIHYPVPIHMTPAYAGSVRSGALPATERLAREACSLPIYPSMDAQTIERVAAAIHEFCDERPGSCREAA